MNTNSDALKSFIEKIRSINFFQRLFQWKRIKNALVDAAFSLSGLLTDFENLQNRKNELIQKLTDSERELRVIYEQKIRLEEIEKKQALMIGEKDNSIAVLNRQLTTSLTNNQNLEKQIEALHLEKQAFKQQYESLRQEEKKLTEENIKLKEAEETRKLELTKTITTFDSWRMQILAESNKEIEQKQEEEVERIKNLRLTWNTHETNVKSRIKSLCQKHTIEYCEAVPFRGSPDNTVRLGNEFIVFDAKSPGSDDLNNFPAYLKDQAEKAKKYAKQEAVKNNIFFVVPSNTLDVLKQTVFPQGDYDVFVLSIDVLEPLLLCLQKIETYEFADQLTPEERENICRIIGRFTHLTKRRIQIDSFFAKQFMEMVLKCDCDLPEEIKKEIADFEKSEKLNPPGDRRTKTIDNKQLQKDMLQLEMEIQNKGISTDDLSEDLNKVRLYSE